MGDTQKQWGSRADWYRRGGRADAVAEARLSGGAVSLLRVEQQAGDFPGPATSDFSLALLLKDFSGAHFDFGAGRFSGAGPAGTFVLTPPNVACKYQTECSHEFILLVMPAAIIRPVLIQCCGPEALDYGPLHKAVSRDAMVESLVRRLWAEADDESTMGRLYVEDATSAITSRLSKLALRASRIITVSRDDVPPLHGRRLTRVLSLIEDGLDEDLCQASLADTAGLSTWHFCRAFKAATGCAPHRFVMLRRLARAQWLLHRSKLTVSEVALACGFSSHSHLTAAFRRIIGMTPSDWMRNVR